MWHCLPIFIICKNFQKYEIFLKINILFSSFLFIYYAFFLGDTLLKRQKSKTQTETLLFFLKNRLLLNTSSVKLSLEHDNNSNILGISCFQKYKGEKYFLYKSGSSKLIKWFTRLSWTLDITTNMEEQKLWIKSGPS